MNLVKYLNQYNNEHIYFSEPLQNNIITDSKFIRIYYSTPDVIFNGIYISLTFNSLKLERFYNKLLFFIDINDENNKEILEQIFEIEKHLLDKSNILKNKIFNLKNQLESGIIKLYSDNNIEKKNTFDIILKISGIWENNDDFGLTFKFLDVNHL